MNDVTHAFIKTSDWRSIEGQLCRVKDFSPLSGSIENGTIMSIDKTTPYASVVFECEKINGKITGYITHKLDFAMLWAAFKEPAAHFDGVNLELADTDELDPSNYFQGNEKKMPEVLMTWTEKKYKPGVGLFKGGLPKLIVMLCPSGAYELLTDNAQRLELTGTTWAKLVSPIATWKPSVMVA